MMERIVVSLIKPNFAYLMERIAVNLIEPNFTYLMEEIVALFYETACCLFDGDNSCLFGDDCYFFDGDDKMTFSLIFANLQNCFFFRLLELLNLQGKNTKAPKRTLSPLMLSKRPPLLQILVTKN